MWHHTCQVTADHARPYHLSVQSGYTEGSHRDPTMYEYSLSIQKVLTQALPSKCTVLLYRRYSQRPYHVSVQSVYTEGAHRGPTV